MSLQRSISRLRQRASDEGGFTIIESMVAITILTVGAFSVAQSLGFGLKATAISRERTETEALVLAQMEYMRGLTYENVGLRDPDGSMTIPHSSDPDNPDYWVNQSAQTYDADGPTSQTDYEPLIVGSPDFRLDHLQSDIDGSGYDVYQYVTWVDMPEDGVVGVGSGDDPDGNGDEDPDADGQDAKRVTIVVTWQDVFRNRVSQYKVSSLFSTGDIPFHTVAPPNQAPTVSCPTPTGAVTSPVSFTTNASDSDGTIAQYDWDFGDGTTLTDGGSNQTHTYAASGTYTVANTVTDDGGLTATTSNCVVTVTVPVNTDEVQVVTLTGATGGTFTLTFMGETCGVTAYDAAATGTGSVKKQLIACSNLNSSDLTVTGNAGGPYTVTFKGSYAATDVDQMVCNNSLTPTSPPASAATCTVTTSVQGVDAGGGGGGSGAKPTGTIAILNGAYTNTISLNLSLSAAPSGSGSPVTEMQFSEDGENYGSWEPYATTQTYNLTGVTNGTRTVYVQYKDALGRVSNDVSASTFYDNVQPNTFTLTSATRGNGVNKTKVTTSYTCPTDPAPSSGAVTCFPEYKMTSASIWTSANCTTTQCTGILSGQTWNFRIRATDPAGNTRYSTPVITVPA